MEKKKIFLLALGHMSCDVNSGALPAALPYLRSAYGLDYQATGGLMLAYSCLSSIIQPVFGLLADKLSKPWFLPVGVALAGCGIACMGFLSSYWAIFTAIAISGVGAALFHPEGARHANRVSGESKGIGLSIFSIGGNTGFILGPLLVAAFVGGFGMKGMGVFGVLGLVMAAVLFLAITRLGRAATKGPQKSPAEAPAGGPKPVNNWHEFSRLTVVIVARSTVFVGCNAFIPLYWVNVFGQSKAAGAVALVIFCSCGVACNIMGGMLSDRIGCVPVIRLAFSVMPFAVLAFSLAPSVAWAYACLPLLGFVLYAPFSSQVVLGQRLLARNIGFASGVTLGLATSLGGVAQPVLGWVADMAGLPVAIRVLAGVAALGATFSYLLSRGPESRPEPRGA
ncbi:MAG: MFS transporter [Desulfovibrio sp.]|uniref:MFS transporter n=1 Tax=Desulfovibrio sp. TaxID=885 RepID=UPI001A6B8094|nr:MFS transporter [Desulfovibrio sp.]MBD5417461.1 MFS transporter [Desulfovibrio sp.]